MATRNDFATKQRKYMPTFPKALGTPTVSIEGYPCEDDEPMAATGYHAEQIGDLSDQLRRYFSVNTDIYVGIDTFIYYKEGDLTKVVAPDIYVVFGVSKAPQRRSFYTWAEGAVPIAIFEFLSDSTAHQDRTEKVDIYLGEMGAGEYFIHQPELAKAAEFRGWRRTRTGDIVEILPDAQGGLFSEALNLYFHYEVRLDTHVRFLRPYLPDGTPIPTSMEERHLRIKAETLATEAKTLATAAETRATAAERLATEEAHRRREAEAELVRLREQLANTSKDDRIS